MIVCGHSHDAYSDYPQQDFPWFVHRLWQHRNRHLARQGKMTDHLRQSAVGTGIAQAFGDGASATVNITRLTSEQIAPLLEAAMGSSERP
jgi:hypothetical protein